jgi:hypothetical protein
MNLRKMISLWTGEYPDVSHLKGFGCLAYAIINEKKRHKLESKTRKAIFVGFEFANSRALNHEEKISFEACASLEGLDNFGAETEDCVKDLLHEVHPYSPNPTGS